MVPSGKPRGYWGVVIALVGWVALTGERPNPRAEREQAESQQSIARSPSGIAATNNELAEGAQRLPKREPCGSGNYKRNDDLCAQWKAADAAADAAWWAQWGTWFSGISSLLVLGALGLAYRANWIAKDSAERQLRAYISVKSVEKRFENNTLKVIITVVNSGQTPAHNVMLAKRLVILKTHSDIPYVEIPSAPGSVIGPNGEFIMSDQVTIIDAPEGDIQTVFVGKVSYMDAFNREKDTNICLRWIPGDGFEAVEGRNSAT